MNHRDRILKRIFIENFKGAIIPSKEILIEKIKLFDITVEVSVYNSDTNKIMVIMDYGNFQYSFDLILEIKTNQNNKYFLIKDIF